MPGNMIFVLVLVCIFCIMITHNFIRAKRLKNISLMVNSMKDQPLYMELSEQLKTDIQNSYSETSNRHLIAIKFNGINLIAIIGGSDHMIYSLFGKYYIYHKLSNVKITKAARRGEIYLQIKKYVKSFNGNNLFTRDNLFNKLSDKDLDVAIFLICCQIIEKPLYE